MNEEAGAQPSRLLGSVVIFLFSLLWCILSLWHGTFYEDEVFNIRQIQLGDGSLIAYFNHSDVHPPGSYLLNKALFDIFGSWRTVQFASATLNAFGLGAFFWLARPSLTRGESVALLGLLSSAATVLMWGQSLRWYAYFNPAVTVIYGILIFSQGPPVRRGFVALIATGVLFHISYAALPAFLTFAAVFLVRDGTRLSRRDWGVLLGIGTLVIFACLPQGYYLLHYHLPASEALGSGDSPAGHASSLLMSAVTILITLSIGNAIFPIDILPGLLVVAWGALIVAEARKRRPTPVEVLLLVALITGSAALIATGLGSKPRNSVFLTPLAMVLLASLLARAPRNLGVVTVTIVVLFQAQSLRDLIVRSDTNKGSFNADFATAMTEIRRAAASCKGRSVVFDHDAVLTYLVEQSHIAQSSPFGSPMPGGVVTLQPGDCLIRVASFQSPLQKESSGLHAYNQPEPAEFTRLISQLSIGHDRFAWIKNWLFHQGVPEIPIVVSTFEVIQPYTKADWGRFAASP
jgi:hypothetical protein